MDSHTAIIFLQNVYEERLLNEVRLKYVSKYTWYEIFFNFNRNIDTDLAFIQVAVCKLLIMIVFQSIFPLFCQLERSWHMLGTTHYLSRLRGWKYLQLLYTKVYYMSF